VTPIEPSIGVVERKLGTAPR